MKDYDQIISALLTTIEELEKVVTQQAAEIWKQSPFLGCVLSKPAFDTRGPDSAVV